MTDAKLRLMGLFLLAGMVAGCEPPQSAAPVLPPTPAPAVSAPGAGSSQTETISIALSDFRFTPNQITLTRGMAYRFHLANVSNTSHVFASDTFFKAVSIKQISPSGPENITSIDLAPGEQKDVYFVADKPGTYSFECTRLFHEMLGMTGQITIQ